MEVVDLQKKPEANGDNGTTSDESNDQQPTEKEATEKQGDKFFVRITKEELKSDV